MAEILGAVGFAGWKIVELYLEMDSFQIYEGLFKFLKTFSKKLKVFFFFNFEGPLTFSKAFSNFKRLFQIFKGLFKCLNAFLVFWKPF